MRTLFFDRYGITVFGAVCLIVVLMGALLGGGLLAYYFTGYQADLGNCRAAGGHYVGGVLGDCVYPDGDRNRVHVNGVGR